MTAVLFAILAAVVRVALHLALVVGKWLSVVLEGLAARAGKAIAAALLADIQELVSVAQSKLSSATTAGKS